MAWATSRLASPADFFPFSPKAETGPRLEFSGNDSAHPTYPNGIPSLFGMPIVLAFAVCSHNLVSRGKKIGMQSVYYTIILRETTASDVEGFAATALQ